MLHTVRKLSGLLNERQHRQAYGMLAFTAIVALLEMVGIASIFPFMAVLASPDTAVTNKYLNWGYTYFEFANTHQYLIFLGIIVFLLLVLTNVIKAVMRWMILQFSSMTGHEISKNLLSNYLHQPYAYFLQHNSAELQKSILNEVNTLVSAIILPLTDAVAKIVVSIMLVCLLIAIDPILAFVISVTLGGSYAVIYFFMRKWLSRIGNERLKAQTKRFKTVNEALMGIKNIKLTGHEKTYVNLYNEPSHRYSETTALSGMASEMPRYALEIIAFGGILSIVLFKLWQSGDLGQALPVISLYAFAGYRLMPIFQIIFAAYTKIRFNYPTMDRICHDMASDGMIQAERGDQAPLNFKYKIQLKNLDFIYTGTDRKVLDDFSLDIAFGSSIGIVGKTGSGKTTLVDIIIGLLSPSSGQVFVDGIQITDENRREWQKNIAYVTQQIYLSDDTIKSNIAFGLRSDEIDDARVRKAAKMAALDGFIEHELPEQYDTIIGENGIRLSGGQRQRIGLARALYLDRPILVLDEATSALDTETEDAVMRAVKNLASQKTIIMIAHRKKSLEGVDTLIDLGNVDARK